MYSIVTGYSKINKNFPFSGPAQLPLAMYGMHLALNFVWSPIFFGLRSIKGVSAHFTHTRHTRRVTFGL